MAPDRMSAAIRCMSSVPGSWRLIEANQNERENGGGHRRAPPQCKIQLLLHSLPYWLLMTLLRR